MHTTKRLVALGRERRAARQRFKEPCRFAAGRFFEYEHSAMASIQVSLECAEVIRNAFREWKSKLPREEWAKIQALDEREGENLPNQVNSDPGFNAVKFHSVDSRFIEFLAVEKVPFDTV